MTRSLAKKSSTVYLVTSGDNHCLKTSAAKGSLRVGSCLLPTPLHIKPRLLRARADTPHSRPFRTLVFHFMINLGVTSVSDRSAGLSVILSKFLHRTAQKVFSWPLLQMLHFFYGAGDGTQGLGHTRQALHHRATQPSFLSSFALRQLATRLKSTRKPRPLPCRWGSYSPSLQGALLAEPVQQGQGQSSVVRRACRGSSCCFQSGRSLQFGPLSQVWDIP